MRKPYGIVLGLLTLAGCYESHPLPLFLEDAGLSDASLAPDDREDSGIDIDDRTPNCREPGARFITNVVDYHFGPGQDFNQEEGFPEALYGPPRANDAYSVVSLGNGGFVIVEFEGNAIVDGPGPDFIVFENPLPHFVELATVSVSNDLITWHEFPCTAAQDGPDYGSCAGVGIVYSHPDNGLDPLAPELAGGDAFDLADLGVAEARYIRIQDREDLEGPAGVFDLDAVSVVNARCP